MALIKCKECGHTMSDKAAVCPHCGAPVERKHVDEVQTTKVDETAEQQPQERQGRGKNIAIALLSVALVTVLGVCLFLWNDGKDTILDADNAHMGEVSHDTIYVEREVEKKEGKADRTEVVRNAYLKKVREMKEQFTARGEYNEWDCWYFLLDITHDGTPELWITTGALHAHSMDKGFCVYTYGDKWLINLGKDWWGNHSCFYAGSDYVIRVNAHMDDAEWTKYSYSGKKLKVEQIYEEHISANNNYREPKEKQVERLSWDDTAPIERMPVN